MAGITTEKTEFIEFLLKCGVLNFGSFTTKSGRQSPYFINTGNFSTGEQLQKLGQFYAASLKKNFGNEVTNLFGPAYKGIPLATSVGIAMSEMYNQSLTVSFNRKEVKDHGEKGWALGFDYNKSQVEEKIVIIEDVTTAGTSIHESMPKLLEFPKNKVIGLLVAVDRMEKGKGDRSAMMEINSQYGIKTTSLITFLDLVDYLQENQRSLNEDDSILERMMDYQQKYAGLIQY